MQPKPKVIGCPSREAGELVSALGVDSSRCKALTLRVRLGRPVELTVLYREMVDGSAVERLQRMQLCMSAAGSADAEPEAGQLPALP